jgi:multiple sugar transport system substrate-binding protein
MSFQQVASDRLDAALRRDNPPEQVVDDLNRLFAASFAPTEARS